MFIVVNSHMSYTKADCCCFSELVSRKKEAGTAVLRWLLKGTAERSHERALEGENRPKTAVPRTSRQDTAGALLPARRENTLRSNRTHRSFLYKSESYTERCPRPGLGGLKPAKGAKKGPTVPGERAGASGATAGDSTKQS